MKIGNITFDEAQTEDIRRIAEANYVAAVPVQQGYGKTLVAAGAILTSGAEVVLVIAPESTHLSAWDKDLKALGHEAGVRIMGTKNKEQRAAVVDFEWGLPGWYIVTPQWFTRQNVSSWEPDALIVDEIHLLGRPGSKGSKNLVGSRSNDKKTLAHRTKYKLALSGTIARNRFEYMWTVNALLWPEQDGFGDVATKPISQWKEYWMASEYNAFATSGKTYTVERIPGRLLGEMPTVIQHKRYERCCDFHPEGFLTGAGAESINRTFMLTPNQKKHIKGLEEHAVAWLEENPLVAELPIVQQTRIRQATLAELSVEDYFDDAGEPRQRVWIEPDAKSPMADEVIELLQEMEDENIVVFTPSRIFAEYLVNRINAEDLGGAREVSGATRDRRHQDVTEFGETYRVLVGVIAAVGTGTDGLQHKSSTEIWCNEDLDRTNNSQARARLDRRGQKRKVTRIYLRDDLGYGSKQWLRMELAQQLLDESLT